MPGPISNFTSGRSIYRPLCLRLTRRTYVQRVHRTRHERVASFGFLRRGDRRFLDGFGMVSIDIYGDSEAWVFKLFKEFWRNDERVSIKRDTSEMYIFCARLRPFRRNIVLNLLRWDDVPRKFREYLAENCDIFSFQF